MLSINGSNYTVSVTQLDSVQNLLSVTLLSKNSEIKIYKTVIFPVVSNGCKTWSLTSTEEYRLRVFKNRVLRKTFGPTRDKVPGVWRRLHIKELYDLYSSKNIIWVIKSRMRWTGYMACMGQEVPSGFW